MWIDATAGKTILDFVKKWLQHRSHASANYENIWVQEIDDVAEPGHQDVDGVEKYFAR
jgi:hypothetical protein